MGKIDELDAELHLQSLDKLRFGNDALVDEDLAQSAVRALLVRKSQIELIVADQPRIYKSVAETLVCHSLILSTLPSWRLTQ